MQKLKEATEKLVEYIKNESKDNKWVIIKHRDIPKITKTTQFYATKILEALSVHENILCELALESNVTNKPLHFKYVSKEEKIKQGISPSSFYYLTENEIEVVKSRIGNKDKEFIFYSLAIINAFAGLMAKEYYVSVKDKKHIVDMLCLSSEYYENIELFLREEKLLVRHVYENKYLYKLALDNYALEKVMFEIEVNQINKKPLRKTNKSPINTRLIKKDESPIDLEEKDDFSPIDNFSNEIQRKEGNSEVFVEKESTNIQSAEALSILSQDLISFGSIIKEFEFFVDDKIKDVLDKKKWLEIKEKEIGSSYEVLQKSIADNTVMLSKINELEGIIRKHEYEYGVLCRSLEKKSKFNDLLVMHVQEVMQIMCAEVGNALPGLLNVPAHLKDQRWSAKVQYEISRILQEATVVAATRLLESDKLENETRE